MAYQLSEIVFKSITFNNEHKLVWSLFLLKYCQYGWTRVGLSVIVFKFIIFITYGHFFSYNTYTIVNVVNVETAKIHIQEEWIELSTNEILKATIKDSECHITFWLQANVIRLFFGLWTAVKKCLVAFTFLLPCRKRIQYNDWSHHKKINLLDIVKRRDLRLHLTNIILDIYKKKTSFETSSTTISLVSNRFFISYYFFIFNIKLFFNH